MSDPTYGEQLLKHLMTKLPSDEFYCYAEPRVDSTTTISRYPDFVIVWRSKGLICIEVKDWCQIVGGDGRTVHVKSREGLERPETNPYETARDYSLRLMNRLKENRVLLHMHYGEEKLLFPVVPMVVLTLQSKTDVSWFEDQNIFPPNQVLSSDDLCSVQTFQTALNRVRWPFAMTQSLTDIQIKAIEHLLGIAEVRTLPSLDGAVGIKRGSLTPEQDDIVWSPLPLKESGLSIMLVRGVVGSGKTIVLCKKTDLLAELRPDLKILVTTFNLNMAQDLKRQITPRRCVTVKPVFDLIRDILGDKFPKRKEYRGQWDPRPNKDWCKDFESLFDLPYDFVSQEIARRKDLDLDSHDRYRADLTKRGADLSQQEIDDLCAAYDLYRETQEKEKARGEVWQDYEDTVRLALKELHHHKYRSHFDVILIDEGQDLSPNFYELLRLMLRPGGHLFVCDDPLQSLWRQFDLKDRQLSRAEKKYLKLPLRTTREIADAAQSLFALVPSIRVEDDQDIYPASTGHLQSGLKPFLVLHDSRQQEEYWMLRELNSLPSQQLTTAVITPQFAERWAEECKSRGIRYGHLNLMKGLEFDTVYIAQLDELFNSPWNNRIIMKRWLYRKLFVAMTRARKSLYLSFTGDLPEFLEPLRDYCQIPSN